MKVVLINRSDELGGAAIATLRLMRGLRRLGVDARMLVTHRCGDDLDVALAGNCLQRRRAFLTERLGIWMRNGHRRDTLFKVDAGTHGIDVSSHPWVREADALLLGWINQGTLSLDDVGRLGRLGKPLIWVMHDMWPCTGVCHYAYDCRGYVENCAHCPLLPAGSRLAQKTLRRKAKLYAQTPIRFVAVSHWLGQCCRESALLHDADITVIGNPLPIGEYACDFVPRDGIAHGATVVTMGAARLDDPIKGFDLLIAAMRHLREHNPSLASRLHLLLYGELRDTTLLDQLDVAYTHLGYIRDINAVFRASHIVLGAARYETFGYTLLEGLASGCIPVTTGVSGQVDIVRHLHNGYVTGTHDPGDLARGIEWAAEARIERSAQHQWAVEHFDEQVIARRFIDLIHSTESST